MSRAHRTRGSLFAVAAALSLAAPSEVVSAPAETEHPPHRGVLGTYVRGPDRMVPGTPAALRVATHWSTSERDSGALGGAPIEVSLDGRGHHAALFRGTTGDDGTVEARFTVPSWPEGKYAVTVESRSGARHDVRTHDIELTPSARLLLESDKPLYQPGQLIHLRAIAVRPQDGQPLAHRPIVLEVKNPRGDRVFHVASVTSEFGVAAADFQLADEILLGSYAATASLEGDAASHNLDLRVERYVLPKFKIAVETDRPWYAPGDRVALTLDAKYFFGKSVAGGDARVSVAVNDTSRVIEPTLRTKLDSDGRAHLELNLSRTAPLNSGEALLTLNVEVTDGAEHIEHAQHTVSITSTPVRAELTAEAGVLLAGVENRLWVTATRPDDSPLTDAAIEVAIDGGKAQTVRTDGIGVAELRYQPGHRKVTRRGSCAGSQIAFEVRVPGMDNPLQRCITVDTAAGLLVRTDRAIYPAGAPIALEVIADGDGPVFVDIVKDGQTVDTHAVIVAGGRGALTLPADERRFGTLAVRAYRIAADGTRTHDARLIHVARPSSLTVEARLEGAAAKEFRPGESGRIQLRVVDSASGAPARASVGVVMVDEALLALRSLRPGAARTFFTLAAEASRPSLTMSARPGGYTVAKLVETADLDNFKNEAARILLAGAAPAWALGWEIDPWALRVAARDASMARLGQSLERWSHKHQLGERVPGTAAKFRVRGDLVAALVADGAAEARDARDPWGNRFAVQSVVEQSGIGDFASWSTAQVDERLTAIYRALASDRKALAIDAGARRPSVRIAASDLERVVTSGKLARGVLIDPWGAPFRIEERPRAARVAGLRSRFVVASNGPDGIANTKDDRYPIDETWSYGFMSVRGASLSDFTAMGMGGLGLMGQGAGGGGASYGMGSISLGSMGTIGHGGGAGVGMGASDEPARVRTSFPETMLWRPEVITDASGDATVDVTMADSITTWLLTAEAIAADGRIGEIATEVKVFQDFFVDLDLPPALTQHDEVAIPVAVYNYLPTAQTVTLTLDDAPWFHRLGGGVETIELAPRQVGVRHFRIAAERVGRGKLLVHATGSSAKDAIEKSVEVFPDGVESEVSFQDRLGASAPGAHGGQTLVSHRLTIPEDAIADASMAQLKVYPAPATHVIEGLDSLLRMPGGCFEQTSSTTYPNALILDYLRKSRRNTPALEKRATEFLGIGYQKLLSFEVKGGGFSWFGQAPANQILTAYGLEEFHDMARVFPVDGRVIERTRAWLLSRQKSDGSWAPDTQFINEGATNHFNSDVTRITAYIALALRHSGGGGSDVERAKNYVRHHLDGVRDPYTLALATALLGDGDQALLDTLLDRLWETRSDAGNASSWSAQEKTPTYGNGKSGTVETTALAAASMLEGARAPALRIDRAVNFLLGAKDSWGSWYSTQATIRSLKALLAWQARSGAQGKGRVLVNVGGEAVASLELSGHDDALQVVTLPRATTPGAHEVELRFEGTGEVAYQLVARCYRPRSSLTISSTGDLTVEAHVDRAEVAVGETIIEQVRAHAANANVDMPIITAGLPPGFDVDQAALDHLVETHAVEKVQRTPREVIFYLTSLGAGASVSLPLHLTARFPARVKAPPPTVYEYYQPERRAAGSPVAVGIRG